MLLAANVPETTSVSAAVTVTLLIASLSPAPTETMLRPLLLISALSKPVGTEFRFQPDGVFQSPLPAVQVKVRGAASLMLVPPEGVELMAKLPVVKLPSMCSVT